MGNYFSIEILAPEGLAGIESAMERCKLSLEAQVSENDNKVMLFAQENSNFEWSMGASEDEKWSQYLFAGGEFYQGLEHAKRMLQSLSNAIEDSGFPHMIKLDDENSTLVWTYKFKWIDRDLPLG